VNGTVTSLAAWRTSRHDAPISTPGDLVDAIGVPFSDEQLAAITAPLEPTVVIAGAGSGKTTVMAARVVWLVGTGQVRPGQVLGLTFTRKAAGELAQRIRAALVMSGVLSPEGVDDEGEQVILTYDSFASRLVSEHGLWLGYETDWLARSRGTSDDDLHAGWRALEAKGLAADGAVTPSGVDLRQRIEDDTDRLTTLPWELLGSDRSLEFAERFEPPCEALLHRVDETAGPNYQPASRVRSAR